MKQAITFSHFTDAFRDHGREDQFSYDALRVLFDWFEQYDDDCGTETELDVIAICCEFSEEDCNDIADNYSIDITDIDPDDDDEIRRVVTDYLNDNTMICGTCGDGSVVYQAF